MDSGYERQPSATFERPMDSSVASIGSVNEACLPPLRLHDGAAFQQIQFQIGDESIESRAHAINARNQFLFEDPGPNPPKKHARRVSGNHYSPTGRPVNGEVQYEA